MSFEQQENNKQPGKKIAVTFRYLHDTRLSRDKLIASVTLSKQKQNKNVFETFFEWRIFSETIADGTPRIYKMAARSALERVLFSTHRERHRKEVPSGELRARGKSISWLTRTWPYDRFVLWIMKSCKTRQAPFVAPVPRTVHRLSPFSATSDCLALRYNGFGAGRYLKIGRCTKQHHK